VIAFDEFAQRTVKLKPPPYFGSSAGEWDAVDDTQTAMWLARTWRFAPATPTVAEAIETLAKANTIHPVRDWLRSLPAWDGTPRCASWLVDYCGVKESEYVRLVSRFFLIGMIARVMKPGVKFDYCLVLEGDQGKGKSTLVRVLGGDWHGDTDLDLHNKDSMSALRGKWVYEFAEMGSVTRAESTKQKSFLSRQFDEFRPVYGRREIRLSRQVVFIGTTNEWEWNKDPTGGRRFWPVNCEDDFNLDGLREMRDQLFAEALMLYDKGERFWPLPAEQKTLFDPEQLLREQQESLVDALHDWVWSQVTDFSIADAVMEGLKLDASKLTRDLQTRVGTALRKLGCAKVEKRNGMVRYWYKPPVRNGATSMTETKSSPSAPQEGVRHAPF
jgi:predicted P-loop ATPase